MMGMKLMRKDKWVGSDNVKREMDWERVRSGQDENGETIGA